MSHIWKVLGIEKTDDIKAVKRAYAKKLRETRPDEKPAEFQELFAAYKKALFVAETGYDFDEPDYDDEEDNDEDASATTEDNESDVAEFEFDESFLHADHHTEDAESPLHPQTYPRTAEESAEDNIQQQEKARLLEIVEQIITSNDRYRPASWESVLVSEHLLDDDFFWQFSLALFNRLAKYYNELEYEHHGSYRISHKALKYLWDTFNWQYFDEEVLESVHDQYGVLLFDRLLKDDEVREVSVNDAIKGLRGGHKIREASTPPITAQSTPELVYGGSIKRFFAITVDFTLVIVVMSLFNVYTESQNDHRFSNSEYFGFYMILIYALMSLIGECSSFQTTPGKRLFGLKVFNSDLQRMSYPHGLWRVISFCLTGLGGYFTMLINVFLGGRFIHDRLSKSYVIDMQRSTKHGL
ncbi:MAG: RDD family protein [Gammaproteobacteria bacterium]|nr:RDD family protein [Gammaproteobacteria bacterium]MDH5653808.1 RDD family protein [Gammaproteobacteria bacterium]